MSRLTRAFGYCGFALALLARSALGADPAPDPAPDTHMPGRLYDVGTHRLHLYCVGEGSPTVLFESGLGGISLEWMDLQRRVSRTSRACVYDRAGYGWSDPGPLPRTAGRAATELAALIAAARLRGPLVLVAHSYGGYVAQVFARRYPAQLAGLILVDSSHPAQLAVFPVPRGSYCTALDHDYPIRVELRSQLPAHYPHAYRDEAMRLLLSASAARAQLSELCNFASSAAEAAGNGQDFPRLPLTVISRGRAEFPATPRGHTLETAWAQLQRDLSHLTAGGLQQIAHESGHHVHLDQPELVAEATIGSLLLARNAENEQSQVRLATDP